MDSQEYADRFNSDKKRRIDEAEAARNAGRTFAPSVNDQQNQPNRFSMFESRAASDRERIERHKLGQARDLFKRMNPSKPLPQELLFPEESKGGNAA